MQIIVHCNEEQRKALIGSGIQPEVNVVWVFEKVGLVQYKQADAVLDLLFEKERLSLLKQMNGLKIINSVIDTTAEIDSSFVRINGWPTFFNAPVVEASCVHAYLKKSVEDVFSIFNKKIEWFPDEPGFVTPRVVSMIINEAYFALAEGVSTKAEMDLAMKLGTAYPLGPFEWSEKIGLKNIAALLQKLSAHQPRYTPALLLLQEAII